MFSRIPVISAAFVGLFLLPAVSGAQNALGGGVPGEATGGATSDWKPPTGPAPRLPNGKPDFSAVWDHPYVNDMSTTGRNPVVQTFEHIDAGHVACTITIDDSVYYTAPWTNERTFTLSNGELFEYSCEENNRSLGEGRIKIWQVPGSEQLRLKK